MSLLPMNMAQFGGQAMPNVGQATGQTGGQVPFWMNPWVQMGTSILANDGNVGRGMQQGMANLQQARQMQAINQMNQLRMQQLQAQQAQRVAQRKAQRELVGQTGTPEEQARLQLLATAYPQLFQKRLEQQMFPPAPSAEQIQRAAQRRAQSELIGQIAKTPEEQAQLQLLATANPQVFKQLVEQRVLPGAGVQSNEYGLTPVYGVGPKNNVGLFQLSKTGGIRRVQMPEGFSPQRPLHFAKLGGSVAGVDPLTGQPVASLPKTLPPEEMPSLKGEQAAAQARAKAEEEKRQAMVERGATLDASESKTKMLGELITQAKSQAGVLTTGLTGSALSDIPGTQAHDLQNTLTTIKANVGFDRLQEMRANSPTGGALGQVSEMENRLLQAVWGALEQSQSEAQFKQNLDRVQKQVNESWGRVYKAYRQDYGQPHPDDPSGGGWSFERDE